MKLLLVITLVLLSFCAIAGDRIVLGSIERETVEYPNSGDDSESTSNGFGARYYAFIDNGLYLGAGFSNLSDESEECFRSNCISVDTTLTTFSVEIGTDLGNWTPFVGVNFFNAAVDSSFVNSSVGSWGLNAGLWLELDTFLLRGGINELDDSDNRSIFGGILFPMDNDFVIGAEIGTLLDSEVDTLKFSFQIGMAF